MRTFSLAALIFGALFLIPGCIDNPADDDDTTVGDDDDATGEIREDVTVTVDDIEAFMGYAGDGTAIGNDTDGDGEPDSDLGYTNPEFSLMVADTPDAIRNKEGEILEGRDIVFPGVGTTVYFGAVSDNYVHAPCSGKVVGDGRVLITVNHAREYLTFYPEFETDDVEDHRDVNFLILDGESMIIPVNYDSSGNWNCWFNGQPSQNTISPQFGEKFWTWFTEITLFANGHLMVGTNNSETSVITVTVGADGETLTGTSVHETGSTAIVSCERP
ncbi:MAG TPA: hypothetical protein QF873_03165 [Patescibacteria group bacterium]|nr:hypothetical protein [Patescibacteria group bacterium]